MGSIGANATTKDHTPPKTTSPAQSSLRVIVIVVEVGACAIDEIGPTELNPSPQPVTKGLEADNLMRELLVTIMACAYVTIAGACVTDEDESTSEAALIDDFGEPDNHHCPSGGGGHDSDGGPGPKPDRKVCTDKAAFPSIENCKDCCWYNNNHVDGWECRHKKSKAARERCWREANERMSKCVRQCEWDRGGITTLFP